MRLAALDWRRYRLPFTSGFRTAHGTMRVREGLILRLTSDDGVIGLGEAAPLAEFGGGSCDQTESLLSSLAPDLRSLDLSDLLPLLDARLGPDPEAAALRCGLETALFDAEGRRCAQPLAALLAKASSRASVDVNATIGEPDLERAIVAARAAVTHGYRTVKLKIGLGRTVGDEVRRVAAIRQVLGAGEALRLDANGAWSVEVAIDILQRLAAYDIEFVEQPVAPSDLDGLAKVCCLSPIPIAADESVTGRDSAERIIERRAADVLILKPMVCGGLRAARAVIELAERAGLRTVVTSTIDSGIGVAAALHLAATLPPGSPACGLATAHLLASDLLAQPLPIIDGAMPLPAGNGLGVALNPTALT